MLLTGPQVDLHVESVHQKMRPIVASSHRRIVASSHRRIVAIQYRASAFGFHSRSGMTSGFLELF
eukprot:COSAG02_NODE_297_length_25355_cov_78.632998_18_plen_65_part_00